MFNPFSKHRAEAEKLVEQQELGVRETMIKNVERQLDKKEQRAADEARLRELLDSATDRAASESYAPDVKAIANAVATIIIHAQRLTTKTQAMQTAWATAESLSNKLGIRNPVPRHTLTVTQGMVRKAIVARLRGSQSDLELSMRLGEWLDVLRSDIRGDQ